MDKISQYSKIIKQELEKRNNRTFGSQNNLREHLIINKDETEFISVILGWKGKEFIHGTSIHIAIRDGQIHFLANNTDIDFGKRFSEKGIPKSDIVIEFVPPILREAEYAGAVV